MFTFAERNKSGNSGVQLYAPVSFFFEKEANPESAESEGLLASVSFFFRL